MNDRTDGAAATGSAGTTWAVRIPSSEVETLGPLRLASGAEACAEQDVVWVRGRQLDDALASALQRHPHAQRFGVLPDGQLVRPGGWVPRGWLPAGPWSPLSQWLQPTLPQVRDVSGAAALRLRAACPLLRLQRGGQPQPCRVLVTTPSEWLKAAVDAPLVRLEQWRFAAADDGRIVVCGEPLPDIAGALYVERDGIAVPAGWTWFPPVSPEFVRRTAGVEPKDLLLWHADQTWDRVPPDVFTVASRAAIRATCQAPEEVRDG
jgi:hypothetical protein